MPKFLELFGLHVFIWSNEGKPLEPIHFHVAAVPNKNATKFWLLSNGTVLLESNGSNLSSKQINRIQKTLELYSDDFIEFWENFFGEKATFIDSIES